MSILKRELSALYLIQISNFIIPLIVIPFLTSILGISDFGKIGYFNAIVFFIGLLIDFGYGLSGAKSIATANKNEIPLIYSNIQIVRLILFGVANFCFYLISLFFYRLDFPYYLIFLSTLAIVFTPSWLFVGLSSNSIYAILSFTSKLFFVILVFTCIESGQYIRVMEIYTASSIFLAFLVMIYIKLRLKINFKIIEINKTILIREARSSFEIFLASFFSMSYTYLTPIILKHSVGDVAVGIYTILDKLIAAMRQIYIPINLVLYAKICQLYEQKKYADLNIVYKKVFVAFIALGILALLSNWMLGNFILTIFFSNIGSELKSLLYISIITQIIVSFAIIFVNFMILPSGNSGVLKGVYAIGFCVYFSMLILFKNILNLEVVLYLILFVEILLTMMFCFYIRKLNIIKFE